MPTVTQFQKQNQNTKSRKNSTFADVWFVPYGRGFSNRNGFYKGAVPTVAQSACQLCTLVSLSDVGLSAIDEQVIVLPGKKNRTANSGTAMSFTIDFQGNSAGTFKFILGQSPHTNSAINWAVRDFGVVGAVIIQTYDETGVNPILSTCMPDVKMRVNSVSGIANSGDNVQQIEFYQDEAICQTVTGTVRWNPFLFVDDGASITNAAAPNGVLTAFVLDDCNNSQTTTPPQPVQFNPDGTGWGQYLIVLRNNATVPAKDSSSAGATFATATITFGTAPADGNSILAIAAVDEASYTLPLMHSSTGGILQLVEDFMGIL